MDKSKKELLAVPKRHWSKELIGVRGVYIIPSRRKHDSGWACMDFVAEMSDGAVIGFGGGCDSVFLEGKHFAVDCDYKSGCVRIWNHYSFSVSEDISTISFVEQE